MVYGTKRSDPGGRFGGRRLCSGRCTLAGSALGDAPRRAFSGPILVAHVTSERERGNDVEEHRAPVGRAARRRDQHRGGERGDGRNHRVGGAGAAAAAATDMVSADALPTVQIDGVVWSQAVVGNTVYAGGRFNNARPAGAAAGTQLTPRGNLLAYDITTGNLSPRSHPSLNGQVMSVAASPDGSRIYVVGDFTTANGQARRRVAAYSTATGALITAFNPVGVELPGSGRRRHQRHRLRRWRFPGRRRLATRRNLAAFRASDGALLNWNPGADYTVWALATLQRRLGDLRRRLVPERRRPARVRPGQDRRDHRCAVMPWNATNTVRNAGNDAGHHQPQGAAATSSTARRGTSAPAATSKGPSRRRSGSGDVEWVTDCHGDNYSSFLAERRRLRRRPRPLLRQHGRRTPAVLVVAVPARAGVDATPPAARSSTRSTATRTGTASSRVRR